MRRIDHGPRPRPNEISRVDASEAGAQEHPLRAQILRFVETEPGLNLAQVVKRLRAETGRSRLARNVVSWHLDILAERGLLAVHRHGSNRCFFPPRGPWMGDLGGCAYVRLHHRWPVVSALVTSDRLSLSEIRSILQPGMNPWHLRHLLRGLAAQGLVQKERDGNVVFYRPTGRLKHIVVALTAPMRYRVQSSPESRQADQSPRPGPLLPPPGAALPLSLSTQPAPESSSLGRGSPHMLLSRR